MSKPKPKLNGKQRETVEILKRRCPGFATMRHLVLSFRGIACGGKTSSWKAMGRESGSHWAGGYPRLCPAIEEGLERRAKRVKQVWSTLVPRKATSTV